MSARTSILKVTEDWQARNLANQRALTRGIRNVYEGGQRWNPKRSWVPGYVRDARHDVNQMTRHELVRKARYFEANNGLLNRLADLFEQYTVGVGFQFIPGGLDDVWTESAKRWFEEWSMVCDLATRLPFSSIQSQCARAWFIDGEVFLHLTRSRMAPYHPRIQVIEAHRVATPDMAPEGRGSNKVMDGIEFNKDGRPVAYFVRDGWEDDTYRRIDADFIVHIFEPSRPGQIRGLPFIYPVINDLHDLDDLQVYEMDAAKEAAKTAKVIKTASGEAPDPESALRNDIEVVGPDGSTVERTQYYKQTFGAEVEVLRTGDEMQQFVSQRPSVAVKDYWDYIISKICAGVGISKLLVYPFSLQGTVSRADLDVADAFFRSRSAVLGAAFSRVYLYVMGTAIRITVRPPKGVNVDVGRNSAAILNEIRMGIRDPETEMAEMQMDYRQTMRRRIANAKWLQDMCAAEGVPIEMITEQLPPPPAPAPPANPVTASTQPDIHLNLNMPEPKAPPLATPQNIHITVPPGKPATSKMITERNNADGTRSFVVEEVARG